MDIELKLNTVGCTNQEKVRYASHRLIGPAATWWRNVQIIIPENHIVTWEEFKRRFRDNYVPQSAMELKSKEFLSLKQGSKTIAEYLDEFNSLSRYASEDTNTETKRVYQFIEGLKPSIQLIIAPINITKFRELVDRVIIIENRQLAIEEERRKKSRMDQRFLMRSGYNSVSLVRPPMVGPICPPLPQAPRPPFMPPKAPIKCHVCGGPHITRDCPKASVVCFGCGQKGH